MGASAGEDWDSFIDRMCSLEAQNAELIKCNNELEDLRRWRDAEKEPPDYDYSIQSRTLVIEFIAEDIKEKVDTFILYGGRYDRKSKEYLTPRGLPIIVERFKVLYWRPLDLPETKEEAE